MKITLLFVIVDLFLMISCRGDQDCYVYNQTTDSLYVLSGTDPRLSTKEKSSNYFYLITPYRARCISTQSISYYAGNGIFLLVLKKDTYEKLRSEKFQKERYDKKLYYPYSVLEANGFIIRIHDKDLE